MKLGLLSKNDIIDIILFGAWKLGDMLSIAFHFVLSVCILPVLCKDEKKTKEEKLMTTVPVSGTVDGVKAW